MNLRIVPLAIIASGMLPMPATARIADEFARALISAERSPEIRASEDIYAGLIGVWDVDARDRAADGSFRTTRGEWMFVRTLEGRAMQDVWIAPVRSQRRPDTERLGNRYGNSLRTFDTNTRRWQVTWLNPVTGAFDVLYSRRDGARIVQEGRRPSGQRMRWIFQEITDSTFHWTGEGEQPDGTWLLEAEFFGRRRL